VQNTFRQLEASQHSAAQQGAGHWVPITTVLSMQAATTFSAQSQDLLTPEASKL